MTKFDDSQFYQSPVSEEMQATYERQQFRRHQQMNFTRYKAERLRFLSSLPYAKFAHCWLQAFEPRIAVFAGSFNPFHKGHYNVLQKAENIFDKVIVAFGKNPEKVPHQHGVPRTISDRQIETYNGLLTDFIAALDHPVVVIRGLRNSTDFQYEQNQYRYIQELMPDIRIVNIFCDKEFEHISSSGIRTLEKYGRHQKYLLE